MYSHSSSFPDRTDRTPGGRTCWASSPNFKVPSGAKGDGLTMRQLPITRANKDGDFTRKFVTSCYKTKVMLTGHQFPYHNHERKAIVGLSSMRLATYQALTRTSKELSQRTTTWSSAAFETKAIKCRVPLQEVHTEQPLFFAEYRRLSHPVVNVRRLL